MSLSMKDVFQYEVDRKLDLAYYHSIMINETKGLRSTKRLHELNFRRLNLKIERLVHEYLKMPEPFFEGPKTPLTYSQDTKGQRNPDPIISLTAISTRLDACAIMLKSIVAQNDKIHSINLYISEEPYLLDQGIPKTTELLSQIMDLGINIYYVPNTGPYRKQIPCIYQLKNAKTSGEARFITIDDDVYYPAGWVDGLLAPIAEEDAIIAHRGRMMKSKDDYFAPYSTFQEPTKSSSLNNLPNGRNGICYKLKYFPDNTASYAGPLIAPTADDIWVKLLTLVRCIPVTILEPTAMKDPKKDYNDVFPDRKAGLWRNYNASGRNDMYLKNLSIYFAKIYSVNPTSLLEELNT